MGETREVLAEQGPTIHFASWRSIFLLWGILRGSDKLLQTGKL